MRAEDSRPCFSGFSGEDVQWNDSFIIKSLLGPHLANWLALLSSGVTNHSGYWAWARMCEAIYGPKQLGKPYRNQ